MRIVCFCLKMESSKLTFLLCVAICALAYVSSSTEVAEDAESSVYDFQKYFFSPRSGRSFDLSFVDEDSGNSINGFGAVQQNETNSEGRLIPGAPSWLARITTRVLMWKMLRAIAQYFVDLFVGEMFA